MLHAFSIDKRNVSSENMPVEVDNAMFLSKTAD